MSACLASQNVDARWMLPTIQGFVAHFSVYIEGKQLEFYIISRRSCRKAGTRYNARGIDDEGFVANFCESEQIVIFKKSCLSFVQIRGSVPVFFEQKGIAAYTRITRSYEMTNL